MLRGIHDSSWIGQEEVVGFFQIAEHGGDESFGEDAVGNRGTIFEAASLFKVIGRGIE